MHAQQHASIKDCVANQGFYYIYFMVDNQACIYSFSSCDGPRHESGARDPISRQLHLGRSLRISKTHLDILLSGL